MKRIFFLVLTVAVLFTSCTSNVSNQYQTRYNIADNTAYAIVEAINKKDSTALVEMFSKTAIGKSETINSDAVDFINCIQGETVSFTCCCGGVSNLTKQVDGKWNDYLGATFVLETDEKKYRINFYQCHSTEDMSCNDLGVVSLTVQNFYGQVDKTEGYYGIHPLSNY